MMRYMLPSLIIRPCASEGHRPPADHPDTNARVDAAWRGTKLVAWPDADYIEYVGPGLYADILRSVHTREYIERISSAEPGFYPDGETWRGPGSYEAATQSAAIACLLAERIGTGRARNGIALTRPPGHHAHANRASGYCIFNNAVVAAKTGQRLGARKVLIADLDAHHGDGTESLLLEDPSIGLVSVHQAGLFPQTTGGRKHLLPSSHGNVLNVPLDAGAGDADLVAALDVLERFARAFAPDLMLVSLGIDGHERDPMSELTYSTAGFYWALRRLELLSQEVCGGRLGVLLEGGYDYQSLTECFRACALVLSHGDPEPVRPAGQPLSATRTLIETLQRRLLG